jgi:hypothetical protein
VQRVQNSSTFEVGSSRAAFDKRAAGYQPEVKDPGGRIPIGDL